ncbi:MAG TPA: heterodisulfide reductase-related iron-sulfur binding cluster, partial [Gammaproteobacteria bacterium]|nr:heterodisulfide reductase-related iron-sulfur binding cluster [Gammaproteobacteria bacterium]
RRTLPVWSGEPFRGQAEASAASPGNREVVLFADTFNTYFEPENLRAAVKVLEAGGYRVAVAAPPPGGGSRPLCCGRTYLAAGMIDEARAEARRTLEAMRPYLDRGVPVVGLEPSCLLGLRDELRALLPGDDARRLADAALLFEELVVRETKAGRLALPLRAGRHSRALVHGHCHQKSFGVMPAVVEALRLVPGLAVETIASGCCGMAGAFGFDARYVDVSFKMGEATLLPAVRAASGETLIVADGTSCRHQIRDGASREAVHVARVLADATGRDTCAPRPDAGLPSVRC